MGANGFFGHTEQADTLHIRSGAGEVFVHQHLGQAHCFKNLRAGVRHVSGNAHFGHHFAQAFAHGFYEILYGFLAVDIRTEQFLIGHVQQRFQRQIRVHGFSTIAAEQRKVMHLARAAGFNHQTRAGAQAFVDQVLVNCRHRQQCRNRHVVTIDLAVRQNDDRVTFAHRIVRLRRKAGEAGFNGLVAPRQRVGNIDFP